MMLIIMIFSINGISEDISFMSTMLLYCLLTKSVTKLHVKMAD